MKYLYDTFSNDPYETLVLLDINMPELSGWDVLAKLHMVSNDIKEKLSIIMVSTVMHPVNKIKASDNTLVIECIEKPLSIKKLKDLMDLNESTIGRVIVSNYPNL